MFSLVQHKRLERKNYVKTTVNGRRINRETMRVKLAKASFVNVPRLVKPNHAS